MRGGYMITTIGDLDLGNGVVLPVKIPDFGPLPIPPGWVPPGTQPIPGMPPPPVPLPPVAPTTAPAPDSSVPMIAAGIGGLALGLGIAWLVFR